MEKEGAGEDSITVFHIWLCVCCTIAIAIANAQQTHFIFHIFTYLITIHASSVHAFTYVYMFIKCAHKLSSEVCMLYITYK